MEYKINFWLLAKTVIVYLIFWLAFFIFFEKADIVLLSFFLLFLVAYDLIQKFNEMLLSIRLLDNKKDYEIVTIKKFSKKIFVIDSNTITFKFEKKRFGRGLLRDFFSIYENDRLICSIRVTADGWDRNKLQAIINEWNGNTIQR